MVRQKATQTAPHPRLRGGGARGRMSHAGSEAGLRGIRRGPSAWLEIPRLLFWCWFSSAGVVGSSGGFCPASWPHLGSAGSCWCVELFAVSAWFPVWCDFLASSWSVVLRGSDASGREGSALRLTSTWSGARGDPPELGKDRGSR